MSAIIGSIACVIATKDLWAPEKFKEETPLHEKYGKTDLPPAPGTAFYLRLAVSALQRRDYKWAVENLDKYIDKNPSHAAAYYFRGKAKMGMKKYAAAIEDFDSATILNEYFAQAWDAKSTAHFKLRQHKEGFECLDRLLVSTGYPARLLNPDL